MRNFRKENRAWFQSIKKLPLKARVGRSSEMINKIELQNNTAAFLKTDKKFEFYKIDGQNIPCEITPIESFKLFEASQQEVGTALIDTHHNHIQLAIEHFEKQEKELVIAQTDPEALGGVAQRAKKFLAEIIKHPELSEKQKEHIRKIVVLIDIGKYTNLPADIDRLQKRRLNLKQSISELDKIALDYNVDVSEAQKTKKTSIEKPMLIISESFK